MPKTNNKVKSLYIHIPFCDHICAYCDFHKLIYNEKFAKNYVDVLLNEIDSYNLESLSTIYIGGGTPTSLKDEDFEKLLKRCSSLLSDKYEFTVEANVENLTDKKLQIMKNYKVNRLSIGIESTNDCVLNLINRHHSFLDAKDAILRARSFGFNNINVDLIFGLPRQNKEVLIEDLKNIIALKTEHISIYSLIVSKGTIFYNKKIKELDEDTNRQYYDLILDTLRKNGYERYEISNFAKDHHYSKHNLVYWNDEEYVGVGLSASGYINNKRYRNTLNINEYLAGHYLNNQDIEIIDEKRHLEEYLMLKLRLEQGFDLSEFENTFGFDFITKFKDVVNELTKNSLMIVTKNNARLTDDGLMILDNILLKFYKNID